MRSFDRLVQRWRQAVARPWVPPGARVLDIGCHQGEFLASLGDRIQDSVGMDPLAPERRTEQYRLLASPFSEPLPWDAESFDAVVMLAVLEHIVDKDPLVRESYRLLRPGGRVILTVPGPAVDRIMDVLLALRLAEGMSLEEHHGYDPRQTPRLFETVGFQTEHQRRFQLGCNYLFVFRKPGPNHRG